EHDLFDFNGHQQAQLQELARCCERTLLEAMSFGRVIIVTNGAKGWVELSCSKFMPGLYPLLEHLDIISARSGYEHFSPEDPSEWKRLAFADVLDAAFASCDPDRKRHVISVGDSLYEQKALFAVTQHLANSYGKSLKLLEQPQIEQLLEEHQLLSGYLQHAAVFDGILDLEISVPL
ncbi:unnamed protein product, partial [Polarella glacialis]